jgi:magnesium chelatase subunit I
MNPEEGHLRPQILDRFGLRVAVQGLESKKDRLEAYQRAIAHRHNPRKVIAEYARATNQVREELETARQNVNQVEIRSQAQRFALGLIKELGIHSLRAELTLFEAAKTHAVADGRSKATIEDIQRVASMALRLRRSDFIEEYLSIQKNEESEIQTITRKLRSSTRKSKK